MTNEADFLAQLATIMREELEQEKLVIDMHTTQSALEKWDSLAHVRLVVAVERAFNVQLEVSEMETINSVRGFYDAVRRHST